MATNTNLGGVFTTDIDNRPANNVYISTENVVGIIFDTKIVGGLAAALGSGIAATTFADGNVVELNSAKDAADAGIDETVMAGLVKYHIDAFFALSGGNVRLFLSFMDSTTDTNFEAVEKMQLASNGIIYQIGVWTGTPIASVQDGGSITIETNNICAKLQAVAETLGGRIGVTNYEGNAPLNIILSAPVANAAAIDYKNLPDLSTLELPKVSVVIGQAATDATHGVMYALNKKDAENATYAPVGCIGAVMACLSVAPANESIAHVDGFNLAAAMQEAELGFGNITEETGTNKYAAISSFTNIKTLGYTKRNTYLHKKGYIFPTNYDGLENGIFLSSDQTLSTGDYRTIARCRVMHKSRRVVRRALLPRVNGNVEVNVSDGTLSSSTISLFQNIVIQALDQNMVEPGTSKPQISGRTCTIDASQNVLANDELKIDYSLVPLGVASVINVTEGFASSI